MANQEVLEEYLVGSENSYLRSDDNNGKVIMLSGKWGSGKTHFWQKKIATNELKEELKKKREVYAYISLYGKSSIEEIENDIFSQVYYDAIGGKNFVTNGFSTFTKRMKRFGSKKIANALREEQEDNIERVALSRLNNGGIVCFDDFERKSKEIDLNDLFGFITQLSLNFECKIVIILNNDVFEGKEKDIFSNVKEKTVSKYLYYNPRIRELFKLIFFQKKSDKSYRYICLRKHRELIFKTIEETEELNARIYIQVLDNLLEWVENTNEDEHSDEILRCLILVNINYILYHTKIIRELKNPGVSEFFEYLIPYLKEYEYKYLTNNTIYRVGYIEPASFDNYIAKIKKRKTDSKEITDEKIRQVDKFIEENIILFKSDYFVNKLDISNNVEDEFFQKINNFIETGILIKDENK